MNNKRFFNYIIVSIIILIMLSMFFLLLTYRWMNFFNGIYYFQNYSQKEAVNTVLNKYYISPIERAIKDNNISELKKLNPPIKNYMKYCSEKPFPYFLAAQYNNEEALNYYLSLGIPINYRHPETGGTILHYISNSKITKSLVSRGAEINAVDNNEETPLLRILSSSDVTIDDISIYVSLGANINYQKKESIDNVLTRVAKLKNYDLLKQLLFMSDLKLHLKGVHGADLLNLITSDFLFPKDGLEVFDLLLQNGTEINVVDSYGIPPFFMVVLNPENDYFELMMKYNINSNILDIEGENALTYCTIYLRDQQFYILTALPQTIISRCIHAGLSINEPNINGDTALHIAVRSNYVPMIKALIQFGADVNIENKNNETPLSIAREQMYSEVLELFTNPNNNNNVN